MIEFFTDSWNVQLASRTMFHVSSGLIQIGSVYAVMILPLHAWFAEMN